MRPIRGVVVALALVPALHGCAGYRLIRPDDIEVPNYDPRPVLIPAECGALVDRAAREGMLTFTERETRMAIFCQQQQIIRAQEEEAAARRLEAHAQAAQFALSVTLAVLGGVAAVAAWLF